MEKVVLHLGNVQIGRVKRGGVIAKITVNEKPFYNVHIRRKIINRILDGETIAGTLWGYAVIGSRIFNNKFDFIPEE